MHSSSVVPSRLFTLGGGALLAVWLLLSACQRSSEPAVPTGVSLPQPASAVSAPFDVMGVVRRVGLSFKSEGTRFVGAQSTYAVEVGGGTVTFMPGLAGLQKSVGAGLSLETVSLGRGARGPLPAARMEALEDGGLVLHRGSVRELLRNTEVGVEQSWALAEKPMGEGPLVVRVRARGQRFARASEAGLHFAPEGGGPGARYGLATWVDSRGVRTPLPAPRFERGEVVLEVPASLLESSTYPAVLDPLVSPESEVGEPLPGPTTGAQQEPRVAFDGTNYLVVWQHSETPDFVSGSLWSIRAARVSRTGQVLDMVGFVVSSDVASAERDEQEPSVAFNGTDYLVAWTTGSMIRASRVSTSGVVLDPNGITVLHGAGKRGAPTVASDGQGFLVVWRDDEMYGPSTAGIHSKRVSGAGAVLDSTALTLTTGALSKARPALVFIQGRYLVVWETSYSSATSDLMGRTLSPQNTVTASFTVTSAAGNQRRPALASYGTGVLVVWEDLRGARQVYGVRLAPDGTRLDVADLPLGGTSLAYPLWLAAAFDGVNVQVAWTEERSSIESTQVKGFRVSPAGTRLDIASGVVLGSATQFVGPPAMASDGEQVLLTWADRVYGMADVCGTRVGRDGVARDVPPRILSLSFNGEAQPSVAFNGEVYLVVWRDVRGGEYNIYGARVERSGRVLDPTGLPIARNAGAKIDPAVAASATEFFVVWADYRDRNSGWDIFGTRVRKDGAVVDPTGILLSAPSTNDEMDPQVASDGRGFLVAWTRYNSISNSARGVFVRDGVVGAPITFSSAGGVHDVAFLGQQYLVTWMGGWSAMGTRVSNTGEVLDVGGRLLVTSPGRIASLTLAGRGQGGGLLVWHDSVSQSLNAARLTEEGEALEPEGFRVSSGVPLMLRGDKDLRVAFDGTNYLVAWRTPTEFHGSVYGNRVSQAGAVLDGERFLIADDPRIQYGLSLASDGEGQTLVTYNRAGVPPQTEQVKMRFVHSFQQGRACAVGGECASGFCVDGVCCDSACGGGLATDCQACGVASGGAVDGACGAVIEVNRTCRASAGVCDVAEVCDGMALECPEDMLSADGAACDDGNACTRSDSCHAGACTGADPVMCGASDACHAEGSCNPSTGACSNPELEDGSACAGGACESGVCVPTPDAGSAPDAGTEQDAGAQDAGASDAGTTPDADSGSSPRDSGTESDAGPSLDAGASDSDAGTGSDAGSSLDAGPGNSDAGSSPGDAPPPEETMGCGCGVPAGSSNLGLLTLLAGAVLLRAARRRHR
ncbi:MYXO-CTERM sorting domain-containing protein [Myxococcus eversor]|uniref:MYXO-CTERM sorting domain-containing protein n=1 Tax=Myxococcus eversor TaxID=2709661 RepID=UPI0013D76828|nr:MYXO-CTERM sorting domain-containing protein [Myxococcus eversor]